MPVKLDNSEIIEGIFGSWPTFHDAEILSICLDRRGVRMSIRILTRTGRDGTYYEVLFRFDGIEDLAGVYCESCHSRSAEAAKPQRLNGIAFGFPAQKCITPWRRGTTA